MANAWLYCGDRQNSACAPAPSAPAADQQLNACQRLALARGMLVQATEDPAIALVDRDCRRRPIVNAGTLRQLEQTNHRAVRRLVPTVLERPPVGPALPDADAAPSCSVLR
jgi:hypothetical protein